MLLGPLSALAEPNLRRAVGFLLIGGVGVALSCLSGPDATAVSGGIGYMLHAALTFGALYLLAGAIEQSAGSDRNRRPLRIAPDSILAASRLVPRRVGHAAIPRVLA